MRFAIPWSYYTEDKSVVPSVGTRHWRKVVDLELFPPALSLEMEIRYEGDGLLELHLPKVWTPTVSGFGVLFRRKWWWGESHVYYDGNHCSWGWGFVRFWRSGFECPKYESEEEDG